MSSGAAKIEHNFLYYCPGPKTEICKPGNHGLRLPVWDFVRCSHSDTLIERTLQSQAIGFIDTGDMSAGVIAEKMQQVIERLHLDFFSSSFGCSYVRKRGRCARYFETKNVPSGCLWELWISQTACAVIQVPRDFFFSFTVQMCDRSAKEDP